MPRRRPESPSADRLAAILGIPSAASPATASPQLAGWVPQRTSLDPFPAVTLEAAKLEAATLETTAITLATDPARAVKGAAFEAAVLEDNGRHRRPAPPKRKLIEPGSRRPTE